MRHARTVLEDLVRHVQPPKGCAIVLTERPLRSAERSKLGCYGRSNGVGIQQALHRKVAELRKTDLRIDW